LLPSIGRVDVVVVGPDQPIVSEQEDRVVAVVVPRLVRPASLAGLPLPQLGVIVTCYSNDTSEVLLLSGEGVDAYGSATVSLLFKTLASGVMDPRSLNLTIQGVADSDNNDGAVPVEVVCHGKVTGELSAAVEAPSRLEWMGSSDTLIVWNR
jgi:hypothetical protein